MFVNNGNDDSDMILILHVLRVTVKYKCKYKYNGDDVSNTDGESKIQMQTANTNTNKMYPMLMVTVKYVQNANTNGMVIMFPMLMVIVKGKRLPLKTLRLDLLKRNQQQTQENFVFKPHKIFPLDIVKDTHISPKINCKSKSNNRKHLTHPESRLFHASTRFAQKSVSREVIIQTSPSTFTQTDLVFELQCPLHEKSQPKGNLTTRPLADGHSGGEDSTRRLPLVHIYSCSLPRRHKVEIINVISILIIFNIIIISITIIIIIDIISDSDCTKLGETPSPRRNQADSSPRPRSPRSRSPRPSSLPGVGDNSSLAATPKRALPRGSEVIGST